MSDSNLSPNFAFLAPSDTDLAKLATQAERYFATDPDACVFKLRVFGELMTERALQHAGKCVYDGDNQFQRLKILEMLPYVGPTTASDFHNLRVMGNKAAHNHGVSVTAALNQIRCARKLAIWYASEFINPDLKPPGFKPPKSGDSRTDALAAKAAIEAERKELEQKKAELEAEARRLSGPQVAVHSGIERYLRRLCEEDQRQVVRFVAELQAEPSKRLDRFKPLDGVEDVKLRVADINHEVGLVAVVSPTGDALICTWVGSVKKAEEWAHSKRFEIHPILGSLQVYDVLEANRVAEDASHSTQEAGHLLSAFDDVQLKEIGLPEPLIPAVRALQTEDDLDRLCPHLPEDASDALYLLASGYSFDEALAELARVASKVPVDTNDYSTALAHPESRRRFTVLDAQLSFEEVLKGPLEAWRIFLHPDQHKLVRLRAKGPVRVLGGAGTGKTVALIHRAAHLATEVFTGPDDRILVTTFTRNLALALEDTLRSLVSKEAFARIDVFSLHRLARRILSREDDAPNMIRREQVNEAWALAMVEERLGLPEAFYREEWEQVVQGQDVFDLKHYLKARRVGRGTKLGRKQRALVWKVLQAFRDELRHDGFSEWADVIRRTRFLIITGQTDPPYCAVLSDEVQDYAPGELRLLRALVPETPNDLFLVGDGHQRIYGKIANMGRCGIHIRGRSWRLKVNLCVLFTTGEIEPQGDDESGELYGQRVNEAVDHYVNTHNFANELVM